MRKRLDAESIAQDHIRKRLEPLLTLFERADSPQSRAVVP
jgi:hypothetical protein